MYIPYDDLSMIYAAIDRRHEKGITVKELAYRSVYPAEVIEQAIRSITEIYSKTNPKTGVVRYSFHPFTSD